MSNAESSAADGGEQDAHGDAEAMDDNAMEVDVDEEAQDSDNLDVGAEATGFSPFTFSLTVDNRFEHVMELTDTS